jgi:hypothetical protein
MADSVTTRKQDREGGEMKHKNMVITPKQAQAWLDNKYHLQRLVKPMLVEYLQRKIQRGTWQGEHPQAIAISKDGKLLDGQHRCLAIVAAGKPVCCEVVFEVPESAYPNIDDGISRTLNDRISLTPDDLKANKSACSIVTQWWFKDNEHRSRPTPEDALTMFRKHEESIRWVVGCMPHTKGLGRIQVAVAFAEMYERDKEKARQFASTVYQGDQRRSNGIRLREVLLSQVSGDSGGSTSTVHHNGSYVRWVYETVVFFCKAELEGRSVTRRGTATWDK